jgi:two-component system, OmpR family, sensor histidine kinase BaeS
MSKLGMKLLAIFLLISLGGIFLTSIIFKISMENNFNSYINQRLRDEEEKIVSFVENIYGEEKSWQSLITRLTNISSLSKVSIKIEDEDGELLYSSIYNNRRGIARSRPEQLSSTRTYNLNAEGKLIGKIYISWPVQRGVFASRDVYFINNINRAIFVSALIIAIITIIIIYYFSRHLTKPLMEMSRLSEEVIKGNLSKRVKVTGNDEISRLGRVFNEMLRRLEHLEKIRRKSTSDLAHELRTPLTTMRSYMEAMEDGIIPANKENINNLHLELMRLVRLINRLGELAEVEKKIININKDNLIIDEIIKEIINLYLPQAREKDITLKYEFKGDHFCILGDKNSFEEVINNLLSNAIKYTDKGGIINIVVEKLIDKIKIMIEDTGIGIDKEDLPFIFERFYRADKSRSSNIEGTGIGLTISKELVEAQGGEIHVRSKKGQGTSFIIFFPLCTKN